MIYYLGFVFLQLFLTPNSIVNTENSTQNSPHPKQISTDRVNSKPGSGEPSKSLENKSGKISKIANKSNWAGPASIVPGLLISGSGQYVAGNKKAAKKLFFLNAAGMGLFAVGAIPLALSNSSRHLSSIAIPLALAGGFTILNSQFLDSVASFYLTDFLGKFPGKNPWFAVESGYFHVDDPQFSHEHFQKSSVDFNYRVLSTKLTWWKDYAAGTFKARTKLGFTILGTNPSESASLYSYLRLSSAFSWHKIPDEELKILTMELFFEGRYDHGSLDKAFSGTFSEFQFGYALESVKYNSGETYFSQGNTKDFLIFSYGFGWYLGDSRNNHAEMIIYYNHRQDNYAGGMELKVSGDGVAGYAGLKTRYFFSRDWGVYSDLHYGGGLGIGFGVIYRRIK
ncbi:MAG: hypothetical protein ACQES9_13985 [Myxococcota bacterium]